MNNKEIAKELYKNSGMIAPGETYQFNQLKLTTLGTRESNLEQGAPAGEVRVSNHGRKVESLTPSAYDSEDALYDSLVEISNCDPKSLRDWLDRDK